MLAALAVPLVILAGYATWTSTQPCTLQASVQIHASPQRVWAVLTDQTAYPRWNPLIISSAGQLTPGATLVNQMHDATGTTTFTPVVQVVHPGLVLFTQREDFTGVAVPFYEHHLHAGTLPMFRAMNAALAAQATRLPRHQHRARPIAPGHGVRVVEPRSPHRCRALLALLSRLAFSRVSHQQCPLRSRRTQT